MNEYGTAVRALKGMLVDETHLDECFGDGASPLSQQISYGVVRNYFFLDRLIEQLLDKPLPDRHLDLKLLLMCGLYSVDHLHRPVHASVNATVETTKQLKKAWAKGLVNAVLRRYGREAGEMQATVCNNSIEAQMNHPKWMIEAVMNAWDAPEILAANNARAPMTLRVNLRRTTRQDYLALLESEGISASPGLLSKTSLVLETAMPVGLLPGFNDGLVSIQDEGAQLATIFLDAAPGMAVLDACAAPGGKSGHLLEAADIHLTSLDRDRKRTPHIQENFDRLGLTGEVVTDDLETWQSTARFDRILLDAPCSATGIIRRHPDIKLLRSNTDIDKLVAIQRALLNRAFDLLGIGGELLYSTCSILPSENDQVIASFLQDRSDAKSIHLSLEHSAGRHTATEFGVQLLPTVDQHDGFYYSKLSRVGQ